MLNYHTQIDIYLHVLFNNNWSVIHLYFMQHNVEF